MGAIKADRVARYLEMISPEREAETLAELIQRMCGVTGECEGLPGICRSLDVPYGKILLWLLSDEKRHAAWRRSAEVQEHRRMEDGIEIVDAPPMLNEKGGVDSGDVALRKLRTDFRFKSAKYNAPEIYMDRKELNVEVRHDLADRLIAARDRLASGLPPPREVDPVLVTDDGDAADADISDVTYTHRPVVVEPEKPAAPADDDQAVFL